MNIKRIMANATLYVVGGLILIGIAKNTDAKTCENLLTYDVADVISTEKLNKLILTGSQEKADQLMDLYSKRVIDGVKNIRRNGVNSELPGAPGKSCQYGQFTQFTRATESLNDTVNALPVAGKTACLGFIDAMTVKYSKLPGAVRRGKLYESGHKFNLEMEKFIAKNMPKLSDSVALSVKTDSLKNVFCQQNILITELGVGTMLYFRRGNTTTRHSSNHSDRALRHATMYLGRGIAGSNRDTYMPSDSGEYLYAGYNNASICRIFNGYWGTNDVFIIDLHKIAEKNYQKEAYNLIRMPREKLIKFIGDDTININAMSHRQLITRALYKHYDVTEQNNEVHYEMASELNPIPKFRGLLLEATNPDRVKYNPALRQFKETKSKIQAINRRSRYDRKRA